MTWILQGNPRFFDVDDYLARYAGLIYWRAPRYRRELAIGDHAFIWRAGPDSGMVASGTIVEAPTRASEVKYPEALGDDLWFAKQPDLDEPKVGILLDSLRLSVAEGMVSRHLIKDDPLLRSSAIVNMANATVFRLDEAEFLRFSQLWGDAYKRESDVFDVGAIEGGVYLRRHRMRERSRYIVQKKLENFRNLHGALHCEVCALPEFGSYPQDLAASVFEVHHLVPLSGSDVLRRTTLEELAVVCANCHRAIHATPDIQKNMESVRMLHMQRRL